MLDQNNNIVAIDNNAEHLKVLAGKFWNQGVGCRPLEYDAFFSEPLSGVRICFFDINLDDVADVDAHKSKVFTTLASAIKAYISLENGPYALIFWTDKGNVVEEFKAFVSERYKDDFPIPYWVSFIDKDEFIGSDEGLWQKLQDVFSDKTISFLFDFESRTRNAVAETVNQLYEALPLNTWESPDEFRLAFDKSLSSIAVKALGFSHAKANPERGVLEGLSPVISHYILTGESEHTTWVQALETLRTATRIADVSFPDKSIQRKLNSTFHIDNAVTSAAARGAVIQLDKEQFNLIHEQPYEAWFSDLVPISHAPTRRQSRNRSTLVAIEVSASCDYSNDKKRTPKYLLGVIIPPVDISRDDSNRQPDNSAELGVFHFDGNEIHIWVNLNFVINSLPEELSPELKFGLKKEIMDYVGNRYANHVSRIGITSF